VRAWPGGTGDAKIGGNYAPGILPQLEVAAQGYAQNLWLFGEEDFITEGITTLFLSNSILVNLTRTLSSIHEKPFPFIT
jgi:branched-chain amino acid aminotransferase